MLDGRPARAPSWYAGKLELLAKGVVLPPTAPYVRIESISNKGNKQGKESVHKHFGHSDFISGRLQTEK